MLRLRRLGLSALLAALAAAPALVAQDARPAKAKKPAVSSEPWPDDEVLLASRTDAQNRKLFQAGRSTSR